MAEIADKPAARNPQGRFVPGQSGNPTGFNGRPKDAFDIRLLARSHAEEAVEKLANLMRGHPDESGKAVPYIVQKLAAEALLDRGCGKPSSQEQVEREDREIPDHVKQMATDKIIEILKNRTKPLK